MPNWFQNIVQWVAGNLLWEVIVAIIGTSAIRTSLWSVGKKINSSKREYGFWAGGVIGGTMLLVLLHSGFISPLVKKITEPNFSTDAIQMTISDQVENLKNHYITFSLTIYNNGAPSVIRHFGMKITGPDKEELSPTAIVDFASEWQTNWNLGGGKTVTSTKDSLVGHYMENPIERGGQRKGFVTFLVTDVSRAYLDSHDTKYDFTFWDINGKEYDYPNIHPTAPSKK